MQFYMLTLIGIELVLFTLVVIVTFTEQIKTQKANIL